MTSATPITTDLVLTIADPSDDGDLDCSSIRIEQPDRMTQLNARYDEALSQIDALDLRIQRLLGEISAEKTAKLEAGAIPR